MIDRIPSNIQEKCAVIAELVQKMQPFYVAKKTSEYQQHHIETIVGAGIWYIPNSKLWTRNISIEAIKNFHPELGELQPKLSKDHHIPRKVAARFLLKYDWSQCHNPSLEFTKMYIEKFGVFNLVTPKENRVLMQYQKVDVFTTPQNAYHQAEIILIKLTNDQLNQVKRRNRTTIENIVDQNDKLK